MNGGIVQVEDMAPNLWTVSGDSFTVEHFAELRSVASGQRCARTVSRVARLGPEDAIAPLEATVAAAELARNGKVMRSGE